MARFDMRLPWQDYAERVAWLSKSIHALCPAAFATGGAATCLERAQGANAGNQRGERGWSALELDWACFLGWPPLWADSCAWRCVVATLAAAAHATAPRPSITSLPRDHPIITQRGALQWHTHPKGGVAGGCGVWVVWCNVAGTGCVSGCNVGCARVMLGCVGR